jgi:Exocyst complex subunit Sec15-like
LLIREVGQRIYAMAGKTTNLSQLSQILVNILFFQIAAQELQALLSRLRFGAFHFCPVSDFCVLTYPQCHAAWRADNP